MCLRASSPPFLSACSRPYRRTPLASTPAAPSSPPSSGASVASTGVRTLCQRAMTHPPGVPSPRRGQCVHPERSCRRACTQPQVANVHACAPPGRPVRATPRQTNPARLAVPPCLSATIGDGSARRVLLTQLGNATAWWFAFDRRAGGSGGGAGVMKKAARPRTAQSADNPRLQAGRRARTQGTLGRTRTIGARAGRQGDPPAELGGTRLRRRQIRKPGLVTCQRKWS